MWKIRLIGPKANVFPPSSKPPSPENVAFTSIFAQFPKEKVDKSASERRIAFSRLGALQSINPEVKFKPTLQVPLLPSTNNTTRTTVSVHPILPAVSVHGKINIYLHGGTYISGSLHSHAGFVSQITELSHRLTYFVEYAYGAYEFTVDLVMKKETSMKIRIWRFESNLSFWVFRSLSHN